MFNTFKEFKRLLYLPMRRNYCDVSKLENNSCLYISGDKASETFVAVQPHLDFEKLFDSQENLNDLKENLARRNWNKVDVDMLSYNWSQFKSLLKTKLSLGKQIQNKQKEKKRLLTQGTKNIECIENELKTLKLKLKILQPFVWKLEKLVIIPSLKLPNLINPTTFNLIDYKIIEDYLEKKDFSFRPKSHMNLGIDSDVIRIKDIGPSKIYLRGKLSKLEMKLTSMLTNELNNYGIQQISGVNLCRSIMVEAVNVLEHLDCQKRFILEDAKDSVNLNKLQLVGAGSLESLCALFTKTMVDSSTCPIEVFSCSRIYENQGQFPISERTLLNSYQSSVVQFLILDNEEQMQKNFDRMKQILSKSFRKFNIPFVTCLVPPHQLMPAESSRFSLRLWLPSLNNYVECGSISTYDDFICKRLLMRYKNESGKHFLHLLGGKFCHISSLLACLLENYQIESNKIDFDCINQVLDRSFVM